jgi:hypothetical protein
MNEMVKNPKLVIYYLRKIVAELRKIDPTFEKIVLDKDLPEYYRFLILDLKPKDSIPIRKVLNKYKQILLRSEYIMSYTLENEDIKFNDMYLNIFMKNTKFKRVIPKNIIYHYSEKIYRKKILKEGLIPQKFSDSTAWGDRADLEYEDSIFAVNGPYSWALLKNLDKWQIDTTNLKNKWWLDLNFNDKKYIMTFEPIPKEYLKLIK